MKICGKWWTESFPVQGMQKRGYLLPKLLGIGVWADLK
jgi:hypothetical protein